MNNNTVVDMRQFVEAKNGQPFTTSQQVAEAFGKQHHHVMQKLETLECSEQFLTSNYSRVSFEHRGNTYQACEMTKDGFMFLVMGFTGKRAAAIKENYIAAFNWMADQLGLDSQAVVNDVIGMSGANLVGGVITQKVSVLPVGVQRQAKHKLHAILHTRFNVPRTELIPADKLDAACEYVAAYVLEGEWISKAGQEGTLLTDQQLYAVFFLRSHFRALHEIESKYKLCEHLRALGSRAGIEMIDHFRDGHFGSWRLNELDDEFEAVQKRMRINHYFQGAAA